MKSSTSLVLGLVAAAALFISPRNAAADSDAYRMAVMVPAGQAVLLARGEVAFAAPAQHQVYVLDVMGGATLVAGTGKAGFAGDGGPASDAQFRAPSGLAVDSVGNLYVADTGNNRIRRIDATTHVITTVVGTGAASFSGDGGPALDASLDSPSGVALDPQGNLYLADTGSSRIRRVDPSGVITTIVGTGECDRDDDDERVATTGRLNGPTGLAFDSVRSRLLVADTGNHVIRSVDASGRMRTLAGSAGRPGFSGDGGRAVNARLLAPTGVGVDGNGLVYVSDTGNHVVRRITSYGRIDSTGSGIQTPVYSTPKAAAPSKWKISLTQTSPATWLVGSPQVIRWTHNLGASARFAVELSRDGGLTWESLGTVHAGASTKGSLRWHVTDPTTGSALVRVRSLTNQKSFGVGAPVVIYVPST